MSRHVFRMSRLPRTCMLTLLTQLAQDHNPARLCGPAPRSGPCPCNRFRRRRRQQVIRKRNRTQTVTYVPVATRAIRMRNGVQSACLSLSPSSVLTTSHHSTLQCAPPMNTCRGVSRVYRTHAAPQKTMCEGGVERVMPCIGAEIP